MAVMGIRIRRFLKDNPSSLQEYVILNFFYQRLWFLKIGDV